MELDIYLPKEKLAFEYQGEQHYHDIYAVGNQWRQRERDGEKKRACEEHGITLIEIPYWWDEQGSSLMATIHNHRADFFLLNSETQPIPAAPLMRAPSGTDPFFSYSSREPAHQTSCTGKCGTARQI